MSNASRVLKNTISLYIRMIFLTVISLFTVRIILNSLGVEDYGLYNVVAGFVGMFSFLSGTLTIASQRFFAISIGHKDWEGLNRYFSVNLFLYFLISVIVLLVAETFGLWFVLNKMVIPVERMKAAIWVYQFSIINFIIVLLISPYLALLVADENLSLYSIISIVEGIFKIIVAYALLKTNKDKLIVYGLLILLISVCINGFYLLYCKIKYKNICIKFVKDKSIYKEVFSFLNWNLIGAIASVFKGQGINILINLFFGPVINAARGVAFQVSNVVSSFSVNFMKAIDPQITKNYASGDKEMFFRITCVASKISYFLLFVFAMPLMTNMEYVLTLWLKNVPEWTVIFAKLALIDALLIALTDPISTAVQAIGKVKWYQIVVGGMSLLNIPLAYILLKLNSNPLIPFCVCIFVSLLMTIAKIIFYKILGHVSVSRYLLTVILPVVIVSAIIVVFDYFVLNCATSFGKLVVNVLIEVSLIAVLVLFVGMGKNERKILLSNLPIIKKFVKD